jgi:hypothetical protein
MIQNNPKSLHTGNKFCEHANNKSKNNTQTNKTKNEISGDPDPNLSLDFFQPQRKNGSNNREKQETDLLSSRSSSSSSSSITLLFHRSFFFYFLVSCKTTCHKIHKSSNFHNKSKQKGGWICFFGRLWKVLN